MRLVLMEPRCKIPGWQNKLFFEWFWANDIFIGDPGVDFRAEYNSVYKTWRLSLFEIEGNKNSRKQFKEVQDYLTANGYVFKVSNDTWRNVPSGLALPGMTKRQIPGINIDINNNI